MNLPPLRMTKAGAGSPKYSTSKRMPRPASASAARLADQAFPLQPFFQLPDSRDASQRAAGAQAGPPDGRRR